MGQALGDDFSGVEDDDLIAEGKYFLAIVGDEENRDAVVLVPLAKIADQRRLGRTVECR